MVVKAPRNCFSVRTIAMAKNASGETFKMVFSASSVPDRQ